jgi:hypothetical protein
MARNQAMDVGSQQFVARRLDANRLSALRPLAALSVGPHAPEQNRPSISALNLEVQWIASGLPDQVSCSACDH